jgi:hypothetical protein
MRSPAVLAQALCAFEPTLLMCALAVMPPAAGSARAHAVGAIAGLPRFSTHATSTIPRSG